MGVLGTRSYGQERLLQCPGKPGTAFEETEASPRSDSRLPPRTPGRPPADTLPPIPSPAARRDSAPLFHWLVVRRQSSAANLCGPSPSGGKLVSSRQSIDTASPTVARKGGVFSRHRSFSFSTSGRSGGSQALLPLRTPFPWQPEADASSLAIGEKDSTI